MLSIFSCLIYSKIRKRCVCVSICNAYQAYQSLAYVKVWKLKWRHSKISPYGPEVQIFSFFIISGAINLKTHLKKISCRHHTVKSSAATHQVFHHQDISVPNFGLSVSASTHRPVVSVPMPLHSLAFRSLIHETQILCKLKMWQFYRKHRRVF